MNLPTTREHTWTPDGPVYSADFNAVQDCIIGAKHPLHEIPLGGAAWRPVTNTTTWNGDQWILAAADTIWCSIPRLAVGSRITDAKFGIKHGTLGTITLRVSRKPITGGAIEDLATLNDVTHDGAFFTAEIASIAFTTVTGYDYRLGVSFDANAATNGAQLVHGAVFVDRL